MLESGQCRSNKQLHYASTTHASVAESHFHINLLPNSLLSTLGSVILKFPLLPLLLYLSLYSHLIPLFLLLFFHLLNWLTSCFLSLFFFFLLL